MEHVFVVLRAWRSLLFLFSVPSRRIAACCDFTGINFMPFPTLSSVDISVDAVAQTTPTGLGRCRYGSAPPNFIRQGGCLDAVEQGSLEGKIGIVGLSGGEKWWPGC